MSNNYQLVIETSKGLEYLPEQVFNTRGHGLHEKVSSVESLLPFTTYDSLDSLS